MLRTLATLSLVVLTTSVMADDVVNVYSARHYDTDDALYSDFESQTGIKVNLIEGNSDALIQRLQREGKRSPADVFITVDAEALLESPE